MPTVWGASLTQLSKPLLILMVTIGDRGKLLLQLARHIPLKWPPRPLQQRPLRKQIPQRRLRWSPNLHQPQSPSPHRHQRPPFLQLSAGKSHPLYLPLRAANLHREHPQRRQRQPLLDDPRGRRVPHHGLLLLLHRLPPSTGLQRLLTPLPRRRPSLLPHLLLEVRI
jgi:hypothetical protein